MRMCGRVEGLAGFQAALAEIARGEGIAEETAATADEIRDRAAAHLPDGVLAQSLSVTASGDGGYTVSTPLDHGWHLEFGSIGRPAAPWLAPAAEAARPGFLARIRNRLNGTTAAALRGSR
jgi:hypothetical protein